MFYNKPRLRLLQRKTSGPETGLIQWGFKRDHSYISADVGWRALSLHLTINLELKKLHFLLVVSFQRGRAECLQSTSTIHSCIFRAASVRSISIAILFIKRIHLSIWNWIRKKLFQKKRFKIPEFVVDETLVNSINEDESSWITIELSVKLIPGFRISIERNNDFCNIIPSRINYQIR